MRDIAELFLIEFVKNILDAKAPNHTILEIKENQVNEKKVKENYNLMQSSILKKELKTENKIEVPKFVPPQIKKVQQPQINLNKQVQRPKINYSIQSQLSATEKLNILLKDPYVNEIECNGSDTNLSVKKAGMNQNTQINLSIEEIYDVIAEFSQKTKIPVINGRIKAALNDLVITAVLSETLGPRFIIQKKKPFQELII
ncbi:hypothetical protein FJZ21_00995 [Candidatus Pacearchaeota archaeon]|nr:hypothetical protein [Candidatus Pacearchaeota archaeon]